jgi:uncharacterized cofD-like protein
MATPMSDTSPHKIVTIGGGSGQYALLSGLRDIRHLNVTAVVSMVDSGGSTGRLRDELGTLPPGDILKCILALSPHHQVTRALLQRRFQRDRRLRGHNAGNMLLTMLSRYTGSFPSGVTALAEILDAAGVILPVTTDKATLVAELTDGSRIYGERAIDMPSWDQRGKIQDVFLVPHHADEIKVYPPVVDAIENADYIILGPGDLFTSIVPNLVVPGVSQAIEKSSGKLIYIVNIMTKFCETNNYKCIDFVRQLENFTQKPIDVIVHNNERPPGELRRLYAIQKAQYVEVDPSDKFWMERKLHSVDLLESSEKIIRHNSQKLALFLQAVFDGKTS